MGAKRKPETRAAAKPRVSRVKKEAGPRRGSPDWDLSLIDSKAVDTLIASRKVGLPLDVAAEVAGVDPDVALTWLTEGRRLRSLGSRQAVNDYRERCRDFATRWDKALPGLVQVLRGYLVQHAQRNPQACIQALTSFEREFHARRPHRAAPVLPAEGPVDLFERFVPLDLGASAAPRSAKFTTTTPDGATHSAEFRQGTTAIDAEIEEHDEEAVEYYVQHGRWPEDDAPAKPFAEETIDALGEPVELDTDLEELSLALAGGAPAAERDLKPEKVPLAPPAPPPPPPDPIIAQPPLLRRVDPSAGLRDLGPSGQLVETVVAEAREASPLVPKVPAGPPPEPLRRVDPMGDR